MAKDCINDGNVNTCERPSDNTRITIIAISVSVVVVVLATVGVVLYLHFRRQRIEKREDKAFDPERADYGMDYLPPPRQQRQQQQSQRRARVDDATDDDELQAPAPRRNSLQSLARSIRQLDAGANTTRDSSRDPFGDSNTPSERGNSRPAPNNNL